MSGVSGAHGETGPARPGCLAGRKPGGILAKRSGAAAARRAHNPKVVGSNPTSATILHPTTEPGDLVAPPHSGEGVNKRKRVALAKRRTKKRKLKARAQTAR